MTIARMSAPALSRNKCLACYIYTENTTLWANGLSKERRPQTWTTSRIHDKGPWLHMKVLNHLFSLECFTLVVSFQPFGCIQRETTLIDVYNVLHCHICLFLPPI